MDRDPINESHDGQSPQPSSRPAGAMHATSIEDDAVSPQTASVPIPPRDDVADRPAGPEPAVSPPPPPAGGTATASSASVWGAPRSVFG